MDYIPSVFPILDHNSTDDLFQFSSFPCQQQTNTKDTALLLKPDHDEDCSDLILTNKTPQQYGRRRRKSRSVKDDENPNDSKKKKIIHRDTERQRRQEMATLYASLRSLLPLDYLRGRRSTSDHIQQAVNYIKHQQKKIQELNDRRDELKRLPSTVSSTCPSSAGLDEGLASCSERDSLIITPCSVGVEVAINTSVRKGFPVSRVLQVLIEEGLSIVSCISTKVNERMLHYIISEVTDDGRNIDITELQKKLTN